MGEVIGIKEEIGDFRFRIYYKITGEERIVSVDADKQNLFSNQDCKKARAMACPFLRESEQRTVICTVHMTRPDLCRQYSCFRLLVLDSRGNRIGKVVAGTRYFITTDPELRTLWNGAVEGVIVADEGEWEAFADRVCTSAGYRVIR
jgi:Fe-S-cluster containining protein